MRSAGMYLRMLAALAAGVLLTVVVYSTGLARLMGLPSLAGNPAPPEAADADGVAPPLKIWSLSHADKYRTQTFEVPLQGDEQLEYKADLSRGEPLLYSWRVKQGSKVYFEFHGQPTEGTWPKDYYESYEKGEGAGGQGSMVAPFTGAHGWYWLNLSGEPIVIEVELSGYFSEFGPWHPPEAAQPAAAQ